MKFKKDSDQWPKDSLKRTLLLNYPGCKSASDAVKYLISHKDQTPAEASSFEATKSAIQKVENALSAVDFDSIPLEDISRLGALPLNNVQEVNVWRDGWLEVLRSREKIGADHEE